MFKMLATPFNVNGVGRIIEIGDINDVGNTRTVSAKLESERRRMRGAEQIVETDQFMFSSGILVLMCSVMGRKLGIQFTLMAS